MIGLGLFLVFCVCCWGGGLFCCLFAVLLSTTSFSFVYYGTMTATIDERSTCPKKNGILLCRCGEVLSAPRVFLVLKRSFTVSHSSLDVLIGSG